MLATANQHKLCTCIITHVVILSFSNSLTILLEFLFNDPSCRLNEITLECKCIFRGLETLLSQVLHTCYLADIFNTAWVDTSP